MLAKGCGRLGLVLCLSLIFIFITLNSFQAEWQTLPSLASRGWTQLSSQHPLSKTTAALHGNELVTVPSTHREIFSTSNKPYFRISLSPFSGMNPNIIPHPTIPSTWIIVAQQQRSNVNNTVWFAELTCNAQFKRDGTLACVSPPTILPIPATQSEHCTDELSYFSYNIGPHDARVFYGPNIPYTMFGSQSQHTCFGQWLQDFRVLFDWGREDFVGGHFRLAMDLQRPDAYGAVEKNWFVFWDVDGKMYAHYDVSPQRVFAVLKDDGSVGRNLGPQAAAHGDDQCLAKYMPTFDADREAGLSSIHQATNSLSVTMCKRSDARCVPTADNTFIVTIFQQKHFYAMHSVYEPYVMLYQNRAPFALHAISNRPLWIHGRGKYTPPQREVLEEEESDYNRDIAAKGDDSLARTEMFYVTSLSWKTQGLKYHGFLDDPLFVAFGIEDESAAGIEVLAEDLLSDLGFCGLV